MKKVLLTLMLATMGIVAAEAQTGGVYRDERGEYRYETRSTRVWIPEQRAGGIFGVGGRTIPGHYETRAEQVKVYRDQYNNEYNGRNRKHPHGMAPGQRKKLDRNNDTWGDYRRDGRYERNNDSDRAYYYQSGKAKGKKVKNK